MYIPFHLGSAGINLALIAAGNADAYAQVGTFLFGIHHIMIIPSLTFF